MSIKIGIPFFRFGEILMVKYHRVAQRKNRACTKSILSNYSYSLIGAAFDDSQISL